MSPLWRYGRNLLILYAVILLGSYLLVRLSMGEAYTGDSLAWYYVLGSGAYSLATGLVYSIIHTAIFERVKGRYQGMKLIGASALWGIGVTGAGALLHGLVGGAAWIWFGLTMIPLMGVAGVIIGALAVRGQGY